MTDIVIVDTSVYSDMETDGLGNEISVTANATSSVNEGVGGSVIHLTITDTVNASSSVLVGGAEGVLESTAVATATPTYARTASIVSQGAAASAVTASQHQTITINETAAAVAAGRGAATVVVADAADAAAAFDAFRTFIITSAAVAASTSSASGRISTVVINSNAGTDDTVGAPAVTTEDESADATATVVGVRRVVMEISDSIGVSQATDASNAIAIMTLYSAAAAAAEDSYQLFANQIVSDSADAEEFVKLPASAMPNFWTNTMTTACATWDGLPFNSIICADGVFYAAGEDGLFRLGDDLDDIDAPVSSQITWDADDFKSNNRKRMHGVYVNASASGPFTVRVSNEQGSFDYVTPVPHTPAPINHRAQPGKGLRAVTNRISLLCDASFGANYTQVEYEEIGRKI